MSGIVASGGVDSVDIFSPKVVRSTMGSLFRVPFVTSDDISEAIRMAEDAGIRVHAAILDDTSTPYDEVSFLGSCGIVVGNEGYGLSEEAISASTDKIHIPMLGKNESLNAAMATGIMLFEAARQRRKNAF